MTSRIRTSSLRSSWSLVASEGKEYKPKSFSLVYEKRTKILSSIRFILKWENIMTNRRREWVYQLIQHDTTLHNYFWDRVGMLRIPKNKITNNAYIVMNEATTADPNYAKQNFRTWIDFVPILIDISVPYNDIAQGREMRGYLRSLLGGHTGSLYNKRDGEIVFQEYIAPDYDADTDRVLLWSLYTFKEHYDYTDIGLPVNP